MTAAASWLNTAFAGFDRAILEFYHTLAEQAGGFLTPFLSLISFLGEKGFLCFALGFVLLFFSKTRKAGICVLFAVAVGAVITNLTLKEWVARPRPFQSGSSEFLSWWSYIGAPEVSEYSFPSGHTTAAVAGMAALCLSVKKWQVILPAAFYAFFTGVSRNYLMVHYPSDVLGGWIVGLIGACVALVLTCLLFRFLERKRETRLARFLLEADIVHVFQGKQQ